MLALRRAYPGEYIWSSTVLLREVSPSVEMLTVLQLRRKCVLIDSFDDDEPDFTGVARVGVPLSAPGSPRYRSSGMMTPGDIGQYFTFNHDFPADIDIAWFRRYID